MATRTIKGAFALISLTFGMGAATEVRAGILFQTGFEPPAFQADATLDGQGGFGAFGGVNAGSAIVSAEFPRSGTQSVRIDGSSMGPIEAGFFAGFYSRPIDYHPLSSGTPLIEVRVDVALFPDPAVGSVAGYQVADASGALIAEVLLSSDGSRGFVSGDNGADVVDGPGIALGRYSTLGILLDYGSREATFSLDGLAFGRQAFGLDAGDTFGEAALFLGAVDRFTSVGFFDNYSIATVPEPSSALLVGVAIPPILGWARRERPGRKA